MDGTSISAKTEQSDVVRSDQAFVQNSLKHLRMLFEILLIATRIRTEKDAQAARMGLAMVGRDQDGNDTGNNFIQSMGEQAKDAANAQARITRSTAIGGLVGGVMGSLITFGAIGKSLFKTDQRIAVSQNKIDNLKKMQNTLSSVKTNAPALATLKGNQQGLENYFKNSGLTPNQKLELLGKWGVPPAPGTGNVRMPDENVLNQSLAGAAMDKFNVQGADVQVVARGIAIEQAKVQNGVGNSRDIQLGGQMRESLDSSNASSSRGPAGGECRCFGDKHCRCYKRPF